MSDNLVLVQFSDNWADEIDIEGGKVMTEKECKLYMAAVKKAFKNAEGSVDFVIGTNEWIEYSNIYSFKDTLTIRHITPEEYAVLKAFHLDDYGHFPEHCFEEYYEK
jgi:hypothetical protein